MAGAGGYKNNTTTVITDHRFLTQYWWCKGQARIFMRCKYIWQCKSIPERSLDERGGPRLSGMFIPWTHTHTRVIAAQGSAHDNT